jgi:hypothetical protein
MLLDMCEQLLSTLLIPADFRPPRRIPRFRTMVSSASMGSAIVLEKNNVSGPWFGLPTVSGAPSCTIIACAQPGSGV